MRTTTARSLGLAVVLLLLIWVSEPSLAQCERIGAICTDGWTSSATGSGACSHHGGVDRWLYAGPSVTTGPDLILNCQDSQVFIDATVSGGVPPYSYRWRPGWRDTEDVYVTEPGVYTLTVRDRAGCESSDSVTVRQGETSPWIWSNSIEFLTCTQSSITLMPDVEGGTPPYSYLWSPGGQSTKSITVDGPGSYSLTVTDASGCSTDEIITVWDDRSRPNIDLPRTSSLVLSLFSRELVPLVTGGSAPYKYHWNPGGQTTRIIRARVPGTYTLVVTGVNGCSEIASVDVRRGSIGAVAVPLMAFGTVGGLLWRRTIRRKRMGSS